MHELVGSAIGGERAFEVALFDLLVAAVEQLARAFSVLRALRPRDARMRSDYREDQAKNRDP